MSEEKKYIKIPDTLDYRAGDFYDMEEDICSIESAEIFKIYDNKAKRYSDIQQIGVGGMKRVYKAYDNKTGRSICIARLKDQKSNDKTHGPFLAEARMTASLQHPNIIQVHEIDFDEDKQPYFTMDLKVGDTLKDVFKKIENKDEEYLNKYTLKELLEIYLKVCDAVSYSHSQGILHLDIKPENIQIGEYGEVLLFDWGLAKTMSNYEDSDESFLSTKHLAGMTMKGSVSGTPGYMAPELILNKKKRNEQTDIYSLGALLYTMLTYKVPLVGSLEVVLRKTVEGKIVPPKERVPKLKIPSSLNAIVLKAMNVNMGHRYWTVNNLMIDVKKYIYGYSTEAEDAGILKEVRLFVRRNKKMCVSTAVFLVVLISFLSLFIVHLHESRKQEIQLRQVAQAAEKKAVENLKKYEDEKMFLNLSLEEDPEATLDVIKELYRKEFFADPKGAIDRAMVKLQRINEVNVNEARLYEIRADMHFIRQEYDLALIELRKGKGRRVNQLLFKGLEKIKGYKSEGKPAPIEIIREVLQTLQGRLGHLQLRMLHYDRQVRNSFQDHLLVVQEVIKSINRIENVEEFSYDENKRSLTLKGDITILGRKIGAYDRYFSYLSTLELDHLILFTPKKLKMQTLDGLNLKILDLSHTKIPAKTVVFKEGITEKLILSEKDTNKSVLKELKKKTQVVFAD